MGLSLRKSRMIQKIKGQRIRIPLGVVAGFLCLGCFTLAGCHSLGDSQPFKLPPWLKGTKPGTEARMARQTTILDRLAESTNGLSPTAAIKPDSDRFKVRYQSADRSPADIGYDTLQKQSAIPRDKKNLVSQVIVTGNQNLATHQLLRNVSTRSGRYFDPDQLQQDIGRLYQMPEIRRINGPFINRTEDGVVVTIDVVERNQMVQVEFIGNRGITDKALKKETGLEDGAPLDSHEIRMAKTRIEEFYKDKGYPKTQVEIMEGTKDDDRKVVFLIHEDQKQRIWKVEFEGNTFASDARLKNFVESKPGILKVIGGLAKRNEIDQDVKRLDVYYKRFGFFNVRIGREISESNDGRWLTLRFIIDEGPRYKVRNVAFVGNQAFASDDLNRMVELKPVDEMPDFNVAKMNEDVVALRDLYGSQGFVHAQVDAEPRFLEEPGMLDLVYKISEGKQFRVGRINIHIDGDYGITKREVVMNQLSIRPGQLNRCSRDSQ